MFFFIFSSIIQFLTIQIHTEVIKTNIDHEYYLSTIQCNQNESCNVICNHYEACYRTNINCPVHHSCNITCGGNHTSSCSTATFNCPTDAFCGIQCDSYRSCYDNRFARSKKFF
eukprot:495550_1